ncbi:hypothetical protein NMY22_g1303 [Coprinellus aureogranulatus]|nr:hypothetical protein NMY22_g1303 [Coprinellus aureogranulatus]
MSASKQPSPRASTSGSSGFRLQSGHGRIVVTSHGSKAVFSELAAAYPLKLLSPRIGSDGVAVVYVLSYGGGLIGGDEVVLTAEVKDKARAVILSQGSTKVFKVRVGSRLAASSGRALPRSTPTARLQSATTPPSLQQTTDTINDSVAAPLTTQTMEYSVEEGAGLYLLPEPVTCFRDASYKQIQRFYLKRTSSLVLLDSITSGRQAWGENWDFSKYCSLNEVWIGGKVVAKDVMLLAGPNIQEDPPDSGHISKRSLREKLAPYSCYAMVLLYGPQVRETICDIEALYKQETVFQRKKPTDCIWSFSLLGEGPLDGAIIRAAGKETEGVRSCLKYILRHLDKTIGADTYRRAFS